MKVILTWEAKQGQIYWVGKMDPADPNKWEVISEALLALEDKEMSYPVSNDNNMGNYRLKTMWAPKGDWYGYRQPGI